MENFLPSDKSEAEESRKPEGITIKQVWTGPSVGLEGSVSANGEHLTFTDWDNGNLAIRNLKTGQNKLVTFEGNWSDSAQYALFSHISPNGKQVVYSWWYNINIKEKYFETCDIRLINIGEKKPVVLHTTRKKGEFSSPVLWYADGKKIIFQKSDSVKWQLY